MRRLEIIVVEGISESLRLVICQWIVILIVTMLSAARLTAVVASVVATLVVAIATRTTLVVVATLAARTTLALLIALGLRDEHTVRELILARLGVDLHELHFDLVTLVDAGFLYGLQALPVDLGDVEQSVLCLAESLRSSRKA